MTHAPRRIVATIAASAAAVALSVAAAGSASATTSPDHWGGGGWGGVPWGGGGHGDASLTPRTQFTMAPDGSSGATQGGEGIPNIDIDKKTIATYYGDPGTGIANKVSSPYISEMSRITAQLTSQLQGLYTASKATGKKPAIVLDTDDTMLETYDMEVAAMHFNFDPALQDVYVQGQRFPATPGMVAFENAARSVGFEVIGITGRSAAQKDASIANVAKVGYTGFTPDNYYVKWATGQQPSYITCADPAKCTTVEYKALTRKHLEQDLGYDIALNVGDQWSDLQGGFADHVQKLPNPTYYLPSADLPGVDEPQLTPRTRFEMKADGSSGARADGEGIPNIDSVKKTIATYYGDAGNGIANKTASPYITEITQLQNRRLPAIAAECYVLNRLHQRPAVVLDTDDTMLWTYDREVGAMHFVFDPVQNNTDVLNQVFPAVPRMVTTEQYLQKAGCKVIGITGRNDDQKDASIANVTKVGFTGFDRSNYYTKWTGVGASQQPSYIHCAAAKCTTIEYKSQTRAYVESRAGGRYHVVANFGDQYSDLIGGHADQSVKLPNPTYYLP